MHGPYNSLAALILLSACSPAPAGEQTAKPEPTAYSSAVALNSSPVPPSADALVGHWNGPEGLFLDIKARDAATGLYPITLKDNLDTQADYQATATAGGMTFTRAGKTVTAVKGDGAQTGFKYLADKKDCLILVAGAEGYCRD
jgi:hypothetical protein